MASNYGTSRPSGSSQKLSGGGVEVTPSVESVISEQSVTGSQDAAQQPQVVYVQQAPEKKSHTGCLVVIIILLGFLLMVSMCSNSSSSSGSSRPTRAASAQTESDEESASDTDSDVSESIEYQDVTLVELHDALEKNPINAKNQYEGMDIRITGVLSNIDAQGDYFTIDDGETFSLNDVHCNIKNQETLDKLMTLSKDDTITVCGVISDVGEIFGYYCDVDYIE